MIKEHGLPDLGPGHSGLLGNGTLPYFDQDEVHDIYRSWRKILDSYPGERIAVAETWDAAPDRLARYVAPDELHQAFNFDFLLAAWSAAAFREVIDVSLSSMSAVGAPTTWALSNHDKLRQVTRYGGGEAGHRRARAAILLMLALPGSAYLYQGEELGLPEVLDLPPHVRQDPLWVRSGGTELGRDGCRVPIPWSGTRPPFGFGPAGSTASWLPTPQSWQAMTVQAQHDDPDSMLSLYREALRLRHEHPALGAHAGGLTWLPSTEDSLVFRRDSGLVCAVNAGTTPLELPEPGELLLSSAPLDGPQLPPDTAAWWTPRR
jgi:alpha-glucosidase